MNKKVIALLFVMSMLMGAGGFRTEPVKADYGYPVMVTPAPYPVASDSGESLPEWINDGSLKTSGVYTYRILNEESKEIEIRKIDSKEAIINIPASIDGYKVVRLGYDGTVDSDDFYSGAYRYKRIKGVNDEPLAIFKTHLSLVTASETVEEVVIPDSVQTIGWYAFYDFKNLKKLTLPEKSDRWKICSYAFYDCSALNNLFIPDKVVCQTEAFAGCSSLKNVYSRSIEGQGEVVFGNLESWTVLKGTKIFSFYDDSFRTAGKSLKLYVLDKNTKVSTFIPAYADNRSERVELYTVKDGLSIKMAKKYHWTYHVISSADSGVVKCSRHKKSGKYIWKWKASKSLETIYYYNSKQNKWKTKNKAADTQYQISGKMKKSKAYSVLDCISKTKYSCKYPYIKVKVNLSKMVQEKQGD